MRMHVFPQVADSLSQLCFDQTIMLRCLHAANFSERSVGGAHGEACFQSEDHLSCRSDGGVRRVVFRVRRVRFVLAAAADRAGHAGGSAHVRARDGRGVAVHGQLPKHHQQFVQRRLRVQGPAPRSCRRAATTTSGTRTSTRAASRIFPTSSRRRRSRRSTPIVR